MKLLKLNIQRFAASAEVSVTIVSQDVAKNSSVVRLTYTVKRTSGSTHWDDAKTITFTCDGQTSTSSLKFPSSSTSASVSKDFTIPHDNDGKKIIKYSVKNSVSGVNLSPNPVDGSKTLTTIPRASVIDAVGNVTLGNACSVKWTPKATAFQYKIKFSIGSWSYTTGYIKPNQTTQYTYTDYTIPLDVANQITGNPTDSISTTLTSYNGTTEIGTSTKSFTATVPNNSSTQPTINISKVEENNQAVINTGWGVYVQNKSQLNITYTTATKYSASIKETSFTIGGTAFTNNGTLTKSGSLVGTTKDSRGYTGTHTFGQINVVDYIAPKIDTALCNRCRQDGTDDDNGEYLKYTFIASVSPVDNKNAKVFRIYYKEKTSSTYEYVDITPNTADGYGVNYSNVVLSDETFSSDVAYDIKFSANDTFGTETKVDAEIETGADLINFNANGKAIAFGKVSEAGEDEELMEIAMPVEVNTPYIYLNNDTSNTNTMLECLRKDTNVGVGFGIGTGGVNHGVFSNPLNSWLLYADRTNVYMGPNGYTDLNEYGYVHDQYGNMTHRRTTTTDTFKIYSYGGVAKFSVNPENGNVGVTGNLTVNGTISNVMTNDSGWQTATLTSSFVAYSGVAANTPQYRKIGKIVSIRGGVSPKTEIAASGTGTIFNLPAGYRPSKNVYIECQGSGKATWLLTIGTGGAVTFSRYGAATDQKATTSAWLVFDATYFID